MAGLKKENFLVADNGSPQQITFFTEEDAPVSIGIVFDLSASMKGKQIRLARTALDKFIRTSHPQDEYFLIAFNKRSQLLLDHSLHGEDVIKQLEKAEPDGNTALYDAVYLGINRVERGIYNRKVLLIISDGQDNSSRYDLGEVLRLEKESGVTVYAVGTLNGTGFRGQRYGEYRLDDLTGSTGGRAFYPSDDSRMDEVFEQIALDIRHMYSIGYVPSNLKRDGSWHKVKVRLQNLSPPRHLTVRTRPGYFDSK